MALSTETLRLASGIEVRDHQLWDAARGRGWPTNPSTEFLVGRLPASRADLVDVLAVRSGMPREKAVEHVESLVGQLRSRSLLTGVRVPWRQRCREAWTPVLVLLVLGDPSSLRRGPVRRYAVDSTSVCSIVRSVARGTAGSALRLALLVGVGLSAVLGSLRAFSAPPVLALAAAVGAGVVLHEAGHAITLKGTPMAVVVRRGRPAILHPPLSGRRAVVTTAAGAVAGLLVGLVLIAAAALARSEELALAAVVTASQGAGLTCLSSDGRKLCAGP